MHSPSNPVPPLVLLAGSVLELVIGSELMVVVLLSPLGPPLGPLVTLVAEVPEVAAIVLSVPPSSSLGRNPGFGREHAARAATLMPRTRLDGLMCAPGVRAEQRSLDR
jgi:hypothetical protein